MFGLNKYIIGGLLFLTITSVSGAIYLLNKNTELNHQVSVLEENLNKTENNLENVSIQLLREQELREIVEHSLIKLRGINNETFNQELPSSISNILDEFRNSLQSGSN